MNTKMIFAAPALGLFLALSLAACTGGAGSAPDPKTGGDGAKEGAKSDDSGFNLEQRESLKAYDEEIKGWVDYTNQHCGGSMTAAFDHASFKGHFDDPWSRRQCQSVLEAVADICKQGDMQKKAVVGKIKHVDCVIAPEGKAAQSLSGSTLRVSYDLNGWTPDFMGWLKKQL